MVKVNYIPFKRAFEMMTGIDADDPDVIEKIRQLTMMECELRGIVKGACEECPITKEKCLVFKQMKEQED